MSFAVQLEFDSSKLIIVGEYIFEGRKYSGSAYAGTIYVDEKTEVVFTAFPINGYVFDSWSYGKLNGSATSRSTSNPFTYTVRRDSFITANAKADTSAEWSVVKKDLGALETDYSDTFTISALTAYRFKMTFPRNGKALFYTSDGIDTLGFLAVKSGFDTEDGEPNRYLAEDDDSAGFGNFAIEYTVDAEETYYLFVRGSGKRDVGPTTLHIIVPEQGVATKGDGFYVFIESESRWAKATPFVCVGDHWEEVSADLFVSSKGWVSDKQ